MKIKNCQEIPATSLNSKRIKLLLMRRLLETTDIIFQDTAVTSLKSRLKMPLVNHMERPQRHQSKTKLLKVMNSNQRTSLDQWPRISSQIKPPKWEICDQQEFSSQDLTALTIRLLMTPGHIFLKRKPNKVWPFLTKKRPLLPSVKTTQDLSEKIVFKL